MAFIFFFFMCEMLCDPRNRPGRTEYPSKGKDRTHQGKYKNKNLDFLFLTFYKDC